ncbi:hypothetical protein E2553_39970 [Paraburkholderia dipogonis]|uniref:Uncharacterized protein n=1 Tax=Paraburkholderia dipogonis TaxID=1211383 RepID=A0A4Y8MJI4_9BURK|nr:hypothetical protein [Paraburkholderia dipogonis]TFE37601.1 hypothetical protein E2553_39970 [Paraburkholderia dipogonis]
MELHGRTLLAVADASRIADWVTSACTDDTGAADLKCANATARQIIVQSGGQFPVAGVVVEKSEVTFDVVGPPFPSTEIRPGPYAAVPGSPQTAKWSSEPGKEDIGRECEQPKTWNYKISEVPKAQCREKPAAGLTCKVYKRTALLDYVFSDGVTVVSRDVGPNAKCQLSDALLERLVANDSASRLTRTYQGTSTSSTTTSVARIAGTTEAMFVACTGIHLDPHDPLAWPKAAGKAYRDLLATGQKRNALIDAWVREGGYYEIPKPGATRRWKKCTGP